MVPNLVRNSREQGVSGLGLARIPNTQKDHFGSQIQESRPILPTASLIPWPRGILLPGGGILTLYFLLLPFKINPLLRAAQVYPHNSFEDINQGCSSSQKHLCVGKC